MGRREQRQYSNIRVLPTRQRSRDDEDWRYAGWPRVRQARASHPGRQLFVS